MPKNERPFSQADDGSSRAATGSAKGAAGKARGRDKRERILRGAIQVFAQKGFYDTRVSEIAKAAGVADGTIYLYFENKDAVLVSIFEDRITKLIEVLRREIAQVEGFEAKIRVVIEMQLGLLEGQRDLAEVITVNLRQSSRLLKQYAAPLFTEYLEVIAKVIADGQAAGEVRGDVSPRVAARGLWGALDGVALTWALGGPQPGRPESLRRAAAHISSIWLDGLRREPD